MNSPEKQSVQTEPLEIINGKTPELIKTKNEDCNPTTEANVGILPANVTQPSAVVVQGAMGKSVFDSDDEEALHQIIKKEGCCNVKCQSIADAKLVVALPHVQNFFGHKPIKGEQQQLVCEVCRNLVDIYNEDILSAMQEEELVFSVKRQNVSHDTIDISDSDSDSEADSGEPSLLSPAVDMLNDNLLSTFNIVVKKYSAAEQLKEGRDLATLDLAGIKKSCLTAKDLQINVLKRLDKVRDNFYNIFANRNTMPKNPVEIVDIIGPEGGFSSSIQPKAEETAEPLPSTCKLKGVAIKRVTQMPRNYAQATNVFRHPNPPGPEISVLRQVQKANSLLPPPGVLQRPLLKKGDTVYVMKNGIFGIWSKGQIHEIIPKGKAVGAYDPSASSLQTSCLSFRVKFRGQGKSFTMKTVNGKQLAYSTPSAVRYPVGTRVIAVYVDADVPPGSFYVGIVAEPPKEVNKYRYLIFFDDGYTQYVSHNNILLVTEVSKNVYEDVDVRARDFVKQYLEKFPERPMLKLSIDQVIKTEWNGKWWLAKVFELDCSLCNMHFLADSRTEWMYRGSTRLAPLYKMTEATPTQPIKKEKLEPLQIPPRPLIPLQNKQTPIPSPVWPQGLPRGVPQGVPRGVPRGVPQWVPRGMSPGMQARLGLGIRRRVPPVLQPVPPPEPPRLPQRYQDKLALGLVPRLSPELHRSIAETLPPHLKQMFGPGFPPMSQNMQAPGVAPPMRARFQQNVPPVMPKVPSEWEARQSRIEAASGFKKPRAPIIPANPIIFKAVSGAFFSESLNPEPRIEAVTPIVKEDPPSVQLDTGAVAPSRAVAKKSTSARPAYMSADIVPSGHRVQAQSKYANQVPGGIKHDMYNLAIKLKPKKFVPHQCMPSCISWIPYMPDSMKHCGALTVPLLNGWQRQVIKYRSKKAITYRAPCGRRIRTSDELSRYLRITKSLMGVDYFDFNYWVSCLDEFVVQRSYLNIKDLSDGKEYMPIPCVNYIDHNYPDVMEYWADRRPVGSVFLNLDPEFLTGCDCMDGCVNKDKCACWQLTFAGTDYIQSGVVDNSIGYSHKRLTEPVLTGIYECNQRCKCSSTCSNRVVQNPLRAKLQVFKTPNKGWGIRSINDMPQGSFICIYAGRLLSDQEANEEGKVCGDEYLAELDYIEVVERLKEGYEEEVKELFGDTECEAKMESSETLVKDDVNSNTENKTSNEKNSVRSRLRTRQVTTKDVNYKAGVKEITKKRKRGRHCKRANALPKEEKPVPMKPPVNRDGKPHQEKSTRRYFNEFDMAYIMDAKLSGNIGRYLNHSCMPNVFVQNVFVDTHDLRFPWVAFFALTFIRAGTELTWDYNYEIGSVPNKTLFCRCDSVECRGRLL